ncbi:MAG: arginine--tRNA ligase [Sulfurospirillaceae bacterium]|nr:arginine--tRNA ligase [Sulfurospirillaceae bacterium]MDD2827559.1 arginine--tRNA ligase [Sulfurospirillaceae bacterium]
MKKSVINAIHEILQREFVLEKPANLSFGHYATPIAFSLAKELKKSPMLIAEELCSAFGSQPMFKEVTAIKGYINFKLSETFLDTYATWALQNEERFGSDRQECSILLEYVSANPTGPLHIGHARGAVIGDSLYKIGRHLGYNIVSEYYINDAGNQVDLLGLSLFLAGREHILGLDVTWPEEFYRGEYIIDLAHIAKAELGSVIFEKEDNIATLSVWGKDKMLELIKSNLADVGIVFENFVSEKSLYDQWDASFQKLQRNNKTYQEGGKTWIRSTELGDEKDRVVVRDDGRPTYLAGDIIYHDNKFQRGYDQYINIWGADHHGYIARVKAAINFLGYDENKLEVILAQMVSLLKGGEPYKMSKRAGNFILMSDVVAEIGSDALRFVFLSKKSDTQLEFDIDVFKQEDSNNPIFYINYAHARINQVFAKAGKTIEDVRSIPLVGLNEEAQNLLFSALLLPEVLEDAFSSRQVQKVTEYLKALAASLHKFYNENRVVGSMDEDKLLKLLAMVGLSLRVGLKLIGIRAKEKM